MWDIQAADGSTASLDGQQKDWACVHMADCDMVGEVNVGNIVLASKLWKALCKETERQLTQNMQHYLCHDLPTEVIVTRFIPSQRIPRTENR